MKRTGSLEARSGLAKARIYLETGITSRSIPETGTIAKNEATVPLGPRGSCVPMA